MIYFPNCKINIGLHITGKRTDGFHNLQTVFYPVPLYDVLELIVLKDNNLPPFSFENAGLAIDGTPETNICHKAYKLIADRLDKSVKLKMHLLKNIPMGAGLGGGSADGAFALKLFNEKLQLNLSEDELEMLALRLGSDCPFFIRNQPCHASGRGEIMEAVSLNLSGKFLVLVNPGIHIPTGKAFSQVIPRRPKKDLKQLIQLPLKDWQENIVNDFEEPMAKAHPEIKAIKEKLLHEGAVYASMTGSGSTVYAIFDREKDIDFPAPYFYKRMALQDINKNKT